MQLSTDYAACPVIGAVACTACDFGVSQVQLLALCVARLFACPCTCMVDKNLPSWVFPVGGLLMTIM